MTEPEKSYEEDWSLMVQKALVLFRTQGVKDFLISQEHTQLEHGM